MAKKHRAQILLEEQHYQILKEIAELEGRSISDIARRVLEAGFEVMQGNMEKAKERVRLLRETGPAYKLDKPG
jgi:predicted DNA-binding ribbon-helix-helix protein